MNSRCEGVFQPGHKRCDKFLRVPTAGTLTVTDHLGESGWDLDCILSEIVEVFGDVNPRTTGIFLKTLWSVKPIRILKPPAIFGSVVDVVSRSLSPRAVMPRVLLREPRVAIVVVEVKHF